MQRRCIAKVEVIVDEDILNGDPRGSVIADHLNLVYLAIDVDELVLP